MAFEDLRDNLKDRLTDLLAKVQESSLYNTARERFESQTPIVQKLITFATILLLTLIVLWIPWSYVSTSNEYQVQFEETRQLIVGLLRSSRVAKEASPLPPPVDPGQMRMNVERVLKEARVVQEQMGDMQPIPGTPAGGLAPGGVMQNGLAINIKQLNLTQIVSIGTQLQNMGPGFKLMGLDITPTANQSHYYDAVFRLVHFGLAMIAPEVEPEKPTRKKKAADKDEENAE